MQAFQILSILNKSAEGRDCVKVPCVNVRPT